jgi:hypothetical protein
MRRELAKSGIASNCGSRRNRFREELRWGAPSGCAKEHPGPAKPWPMHCRNIIENALSLALLREARIFDRKKLRCNRCGTSEQVHSQTMYHSGVFQNCSATHRFSETDNRESAKQASFLDVGWIWHAYAHDKKKSGRIIHACIIDEFRSTPRICIKNCTTSQCDAAKSSSTKSMGNSGTCADVATQGLPQNVMRDCAQDARLQVGGPTNL